MTITADIYLEFIENHLPALKAGTYRFAVSQTLAGQGIGEGNSFAVSLPEFIARVEGERFSIQPAEVVSVFPPNNSLGHYASVLPHISLKRDTLPWERMLAAATDEASEARLEKMPWMALLVLNEDEILTDTGAPPKTVAEHQEAEHGYTKSVAMLSQGAIRGEKWPPALGPGESRDEQFKVIYVKKAALARVLAGAEALTWLAHARKSRIGLRDVAAGQRVEICDAGGTCVHQEQVPAGAEGQTDYFSLDCGALSAGEYTIKVDGAPIAGQPLAVKPGDQVGSETAIVVANRLPREGVKSIIHLVSLENRYKAQGDDFVFDFGGYGEAVPLVSLYDWSFTALTEKETFRHILLHLNNEFLFGIDSGPLPSRPDIAALRSGFSAGRRPLGEGATVVDSAVKELRDKDHIYYFGAQGDIYTAAGRRVARGTGAPPEGKDAAAARIPGTRLHAKSTQYGDAKARQLWIRDGDTSYFASEDLNSRRLLVYALPEDDTPSLRLPSREGTGPAVERANHYLKQGYVPLPHFFRAGGKGVSWYRGPLLSGKAVKQIPDDQFPARAADELLRYDSAYGMFDTSYAAAWELGRLLCLQNKRVSLELYRWRRTHIRLLKAMEQQHLHPHLPFRANDPGAVVLPDIAEQWLSDISLLKGLPFSYLVPDERMLPLESLRFFYLDPSWISCLVDGALSIGRAHRNHDAAVHKRLPADGGDVSGKDVISGFLLRSGVVKGWSNLQANAFGDVAAANELTCLRLERLSENTLLGLFQGEIRALDLHEQPDTTHIGFHAVDEAGEASRYVKFLNKADGQESEESLKPEGGTDYFDEGMRVMRPWVLAAALEARKAALGYTRITSAQFALSMMEGVARVRFIRGQR